MYSPLVKGTSDENEKVDVLEILIDKTLSRESFPIINEYNWGRSNELNQINQTSQTQFSCFSK